MVCSGPAAGEDVARVETALAAPGYSAARVFQRPGILMGWAAGCEPHAAGGFAVSPQGDCCCWDGRLDNRADLLRRLELPADCGDGDIVLALYDRAGVDGLKDVIGDWSLAIWDARRRTAVLASDFAGVRPLYYARCGHTWCWSSSLADLAAWADNPAIDEIYAAGFLARGSAVERTPYRGIRSVLPAHAIEISGDRLEKREFWSLNGHRELRYQDERSYQEQFLDLFRRAVEARLSVASPNCAELSGGLDSSSVVCMADRLGKGAGSGFRGLYTFSYTHDRCPDEKYFLEVERNCTVSAAHLQLPEYPSVTPVLAGYAAPAWWEPRFRELSRRMAAIGSGVLLTGQLGDFITGNTNDDTDQVADSLSRLRFRQAATDAYGWARSLRAPIYPILWRGLRMAWSSWTPPLAAISNPAGLPTSTEDSLAPALWAQLFVEERERSRTSAWRSARPGLRRRLRDLDSMLQTRRLQTPEALQHVSVTHPFAHRPLVEFMTSIPGRVVCSPGQPRRLMRRAFEGLLPPLVLNRKSKAAYTAAYVGALFPMAAEMLHHPDQIQVIERGYAKRESLVGRLENFMQGLECNESQLRAVILFEYWLRNRERRSLTGCPEFSRERKSPDASHGLEPSAPRMYRQSA